MAGGDSPVKLGIDFSHVLLQASFDGRLKDNEGNKSATGDLCSLTAGKGKDLYLTAAKITFYLEGGDSRFSQGVELKANNVTKETSRGSLAGLDGSSFAGDLTVIYEFKNLFHKVTSNQVLKLEVVTLGANVGVEGFIQAIEVPKGENPLKYTGE